MKEYAGLVRIWMVVCKLNYSRFMFVNFTAMSSLFSEHQSRTNTIYMNKNIFELLRNDLKIEAGTVTRNTKDC